MKTPLIFSAGLLMATLSYFEGLHPTRPADASPVVEEAALNFDTFLVVRQLFPPRSAKAAAKDTLVLIAQTIQKPTVKVTAGWSYKFDPLPYRPFDGTKGLAAAPDTIVWTSKPYKPN